MGDNNYYLDLAAAFVRGRLSGCEGLSTEQIFTKGTQAGLRLHKFKRTAILPRVQKVLGILQNLNPANLLDIGSGRGAFLWPLLDHFQELEVTTIDKQQQRAFDIDAVRKGGMQRIRSSRMDVHHIGLQSEAFDVVTILEVLEHLPHPYDAAKEALRVSRKFVIASAPSQEDSNPEHIQFFRGTALDQLFLDAGAVSVKCAAQTLSHRIVLAKAR